jgi:hypothetical protein
MAISCHASHMARRARVRHSSRVLSGKGNADGLGRRAREVGAARHFRCGGGGGRSACDARARHLPERPKGRCVVVGAGKSAAVMAAALEAAWPDVPLSGVVVTRYEHAVPTQRIRVIEASHPVPDANSEAGRARRAGGRAGSWPG